VTGLWEPTDMATTRHPQTLELNQSGATVTGRWRTYDYSVVIEDEPLSGTVANPKSINISEHGGCQSQLIGTFNLDLTQLTGTQTRLPMCGVPVQITWLRR